MKEMLGGCCVCSDERGWAENPLVYCDGAGCNVAVHQAAHVGARRGGSPVAAVAPVAPVSGIRSSVPVTCFELPRTRDDASQHSQAAWSKSSCGQSTERAPTQRPLRRMAASCWFQPLEEEFVVVVRSWRDAGNLTGTTERAKKKLREKRKVRAGRLVANFPVYGRVLYRLCGIAAGYGRNCSSK
ncbi:protein AF-10-like [Tropilaelaps mercedesae]|uniref:Protein AF-10-like n=1 Tax=Tropilaelaps mercedesae TaxID=418985 RepID=A0A1V9XK15_9ACAR|nr:protein AF-10-like [Tropilaelaps mercedesae]